MIRTFYNGLDIKCNLLYGYYILKKCIMVVYNYKF